MWDFICLWPFLLLFLISLLLRWDKGGYFVKEGMRLVAWNIWITTCWTLKLPRPVLFNTPGDQESEVKLVCKPTALANYIKQHCHILIHSPVAKWPRTDPHLQILFNLMWPTEEDGGVYFKRDNLLLQDGGIIALDWAVGLKDQKGQAKKDCPPGGRVLGCHTSNPPIIILIPNALGKITQHLLSLCCLALQQGFYPVVFSRRGHGSCPLTTPRYQQFGDPSDLVQAVAYLRNRHPSSVLLAVSEGSGSGLLLSYLGEYGSSSYLVAAACISPVFHGQAWFETPLPWLYNEAVLLYRKLQLSRYATALSSVMDVETILRSRSLQDMERLIFCSARQQDNSEMDTLDQGREQRSRSSMKFDWVGYWDRNEPLRDADEVAVPVLCLCSSDDPLLPPSSTLPISLFRNSPYFFLALTTQGSHCGFMQEKHGGTGSWSHEAVLEYFRAVGDFFKVEERNFVMEGFVGQGAVQSLRQRTCTVLPRKRRAVMFRRERPVFGPQRQLSVHSGLVPFEEEHDTFTWNRSYTR
ncbi:protein ABHD15 [Colossoma macropomum]|uniref:protein ABHD15 n=1 Tax=Colossoma macropomum TaxID=42526 RepID=UPI0018645980|nr:protein ABHD15 [Colossoma macropomum]